MATAEGPAPLGVAQPALSNSARAPLALSEAHKLATIFTFYMQLRLELPADPRAAPPGFAGVHAPARTRTAAVPTWHPRAFKLVPRICNNSTADQRHSK